VLIPALNEAKRDRELGTLTEEDVQFIIDATRAIVDDLGTRQPQHSPSGATQGPSLRIIGCPAEDEADELVLLMLRQLFDPSQCMLEIISAEMLTSEVLSVVEQQHAQLICIATLPPGPLAPTRYLCKRLRARSPECKIVVGRCGWEKNSDEVRTILLAAGADEVETTLRETLTQVVQLCRLLPALEPQPSFPSIAAHNPSEGKVASE
jgi:hypothetical protein